MLVQAWGGGRTIAPVAATGQGTVALCTTRTRDYTTVKRKRQKTELGVRFEWAKTNQDRFTRLAMTGSGFSNSPPPAQAQNPVVDFDLLKQDRENQQQLGQFLGGIWRALPATPGPIQAGVAGHGHDQRFMDRGIGDSYGQLDVAGRPGDGEREQPNAFLQTGG